MTAEREAKLERLLRWQAGETPGPWELLLFPTNRCNQRCTICWQRTAETQYGKVDCANEIADERLLTLVDEAAELGVREWCILGGGDPLMRVDIVMEMCERILARGMNGSIFTNGIGFKREHLERLTRIGWRRIDISLDGPNAEVNDHIRNKGSFERATRNIRVLTELKREGGADKPLVGLHAVLTSTNCDKIAQMVQLTHDLECDDFGLAELQVHGDTCKEFVLSAEQRAELPGRLREAMALGDRLHIPNNIGTLLPPEEQEAAGQAPAIAGDGRFTEAACFEAWLTMTIVADGRVGPCCVFWEEQAQTVHDNSLEEAWLGPYLQDVRKRLLARRDLPGYCKFCASHIITLTEDMRQAFLAKERTQWAEMRPAQRARFLAGRFASTLRGQGLRKTLRRAREWAQLHLS